MELDLSHPVRNFFAIDKVSNTSKCLIDSSCRRHVRPMVGYHSGNLLRHVKRWHVKEYGEIVQLQKSAPLKRKRSDDDDNEVKRFTVGYSVSYVRDACLEIVTTNGRPFSFLAASGFQKLIAPITAALNYPINPEKVRDMVPAKASQIRQKIAEELRGKLFCLKIDSAKRLDRSLLGQYCRKRISVPISTIHLFTVHFFRGERSVYQKWENCSKVPCHGGVIRSADRGIFEKQGHVCFKKI
jgi:hypothetical protein